jgi:glycosyltransferase involved in cell wall biosynthesis
LFKWALAGPQVHYLFENGDDPATIGVDPKDASRVTIVGGAGINLAAFAAAPMPPAPPLRVAVVARMLWQKGIDVAVEAVQRARARGAAIELSLYGLPDPANPKSIAHAELDRWNALPGTAWYGYSNDVRSVWANHHVCCLPSRGGEGLPRSILEAAACARPIVTTDVPGCRAFVQNGLNGLVIPAGDPEALAQALMVLAGDPDRLASMGAAARERVSGFYTEDAVSAAVTDIYRRLLA